MFRASLLGAVLPLATFPASDGACKPNPQAPLAPAALPDAFAALTPAPPARQQPAIGQKVRSGETWAGLWFAGRARSGFEGTTSAPVVGATLRTIKVTDPGEYGVTFTNAANVTIDGFRISRSGVASVEYPEGIALGRKGAGTTGSDILIQNGTVSGFQAPEVAGRYRNGDGISDEAGYTRVTIRNVVSSDNADGGFDLKSSDTKLEDVTAIGNGRNYRFWGTGTATTIISRDARFEDIGLYALSGKAADWHIRKLIVIRDGNNAAPLIASDQADARLTIDSCELRGVPSGTPIIKGHATLMLGPGCDPAGRR